MLLLGSLLLVVSVMCAEREYFHISNQTTWDDARNHCQICYKDLTPITPTNAELIGFNLSSDYWVGLRQNMNGSNFWQRWVNGEPVLYQNWYPGHPIPKKKPEPQPTCPPPPPTTSSPPPTPPPAYNNTKPEVFQCPAFAKLCSCLTSHENDIHDFDPTIIYNIPNDTSLSGMLWCPALSKLCACLNSSEDNETFITESTTVFTTSSLVTTPPSITSTTMLPAISFPQMTISEPEYIEDSCVALLIFGMWQEKQCNETLPYICYDDRYIGNLEISSVTKAGAMLNWSEAGIDIDEYIVKIDGGKNETITQVNGTTSYQFEALSPGSLYQVQVIPVKCNRSLNPQNISFYTLPEEIRNLNIVDVGTTTIRLNWTPSSGTMVSYLVITQLGNENKSCTPEDCAMTSLKPGQQYNFTVKAVVNKTIFGEPGYATNCTKPSKVTDLISLNNDSFTIYANWNSTDDNKSQYRYNLTLADISVLQDDTNFYNFYNLTPGNNYTLTVVAIEPNCSQKGEAVSINAYTTPMRVINLHLTSDDNSINATWDRPYGSFSYFIVEIFSPMIPASNKTYNITDLKCHFLYLQTAALYNVSVKTYVKYDLKSSEPASQTVFTTPKPPRNAKVDIINTTAVNVSWLNPENADDVQGIKYVVSYLSDFWNHGGNFSITGWNNVIIDGLKSGSKYNFNVTVCAGNLTSHPASSSGLTKYVNRTLSIMMLCSSSFSLNCMNSSVMNNVLTAMANRINDKYKDSIFWNLTIRNRN